MATRKYCSTLVPCFAAHAARGFVLLSLVFPLSGHTAPPTSVQPGTRAMGMAGVFLAQSDDSSGIWYNPSGPRHDRGLRQDISIDIGATAAPALASDGRAAGYRDRETHLRFASWYRGLGADDVAESASMAGIGVAYLQPYKDTVYVDAARSLVDSTPFGRVDVDYRQISGHAAYSPRAGLSLGGTIDYVWTDVACFDFSPCVDHGPTGVGGSIAASYDVSRSSAYAMTIAALWRSRANLGYSAASSSGLGTVLDRFVADRPETRGVGATLRLPTHAALFNTNVLLEQVGWSSATHSATLLDDVTVLGAGVEALRPVGGSDVAAGRFGARRENGKSAATALAAGIGYGINNKHMFDLAVQRVRSGGGEGAWSWSISYSIQN